MEQPRIYQQSGADAAADWLPPNAALALFEPPEGVQQVAAGQTRQAERVRYGFRVGTLGLLIPLHAGNEVVEMPAVAMLPGAPPGFLGLFNLRGNLVPLYELRALLHMEPRKSSVVPMALIFDQGDNAVAMVVDGFPVALTALRPLSELPPLPGTLQDHVHTGFAKENMVWLEFDHVSFFDAMSRGIRMETIT